MNKIKIKCTPTSLVSTSHNIYTVSYQQNKQYSTEYHNISHYQTLKYGDDFGLFIKMTNNPHSMLIIPLPASPQ